MDVQSRMHSRFNNLNVLKIKLRFMCQFTTCNWRQFCALQSNFRGRRSTNQKSINERLAPFATVEPELAFRTT